MKSLRHHNVSITFKNQRIFAIGDCNIKTDFRESFLNKRLKKRFLRLPEPKCYSESLKNPISIHSWIDTRYFALAKNFSHQKKILACYIIKL